MWSEILAPANGRWGVLKMRINIWIKAKRSKDLLLSDLYPVLSMSHADFKLFPVNHSCDPEKGAPEDGHPTNFFLGTIALRHRNLYHLRFSPAWGML